jgi:PKD repeat protein
MYPNCPTEACTNIDVTQFAMDCSALFSYQQTGYSFYFTNASTGYYDMVAWDFGNGEVSTSNDAYVILQPGVYVVSLTVSNSQTNCANTYQETIEVAMPAHLCMFIYDDTNQNGMQDANEVGVDSMVVSWGNYTWTVLDGVLDAYVYPASSCLSFSGEEFFANITEMPLWDASFVNNSYLLTLAPNEELCPVNIGIYIPTSTVCGTYYADANNNGVMDNNEVGIPFSELSFSLVGGNTMVVTDANGDYCIEMPLNSSAWILPLRNGLASDLIVPSTLWLGAEAPYLEDIDFGLYYLEDAMDLGISLSQGASVTPGLGTAYYVTVQNYSNLSATATVSVELDPLQTIDWMTTRGAVLANVGTWSIALDPYENWNGTLYVNNNVQMVLDDAAVAIASVDVTSMEPDVSLINNTAVLNSIVVGSYDPNNKLVHPAGEGLEGRISPTVNSLQYTINFQNTGSAPAQNIQITDDLPYLLDPSSIVMLQSSHAATMMVEGQHVEWTFNNIQLPDSTTNEPLSHGHVTFRILPWAPFIDGQVIQNEAAIYFDFNEPVITNTAVSTIDANVGVKEEPIATVILFPNPCALDFIQMSGISGDIEGINHLGQVVRRERLANGNTPLHVHDLSPGVYILRSINTRRQASFIKK